jgi:hypothetical protein
MCPHVPDHLRLWSARFRDFWDRIAEVPGHSPEQFGCGSSGGDDDGLVIPRVAGVPGSA